MRTRHLLLPTSFALVLATACSETGSNALSSAVHVDNPRASGDCLTVLGDRVWLDSNANGLQDAGEPPILGAVVHLSDTAGNRLASASVSFLGHYMFFSVCPGDYVLEVDESSLPAGLVPTGCDVGDDDTMDSECSGVVVSLSGDQLNDSTIDFGYRTPPEGDPEACGPGFWRHESHFAHWGAPFTPDTRLSAVLDRSVPGDPTLYGALNDPGGHPHNVLFHGVAALLNAACPEVNYSLTTQEVVSLLRDLMDGADPKAIKRTLTEANDATCPLN